MEQLEKNRKDILDSDLELAKRLRAEQLLARISPRSKCGPMDLFLGKKLVKF